MPAKRGKKRAPRVDVPGREYARLAAQWFPELGFDYPYSKGMGDMDVPPNYRERIDALIDGAVIPPDPKAPYSEVQALALGLPADKIEADRRKYQAPEFARPMTREAERARQQMLDARKPVSGIIRSAALPPKLTRNLIAAVEEYAQKAFEHGHAVGQFHQSIHGSIKREYGRVDAAGRKRKDRTEQRRDAIRAFIVGKPMKGHSVARYVQLHGRELRASLQERGFKQVLESDTALEKEIGRAIRPSPPPKQQIV
jgi:hypothetical protein